MIKSYKDLDVYKESYSLALEMHKMTKTYPESERYEMGGQLRRAAISIPMNIAEGYGKKESTLDFKRFLRMSLGSCNEVQVLIDIGKDLEYITMEQHLEMWERYNVLGKRISTLIERWK
jgi:S23 ribosomal protein.